MYLCHRTLLKYVIYRFKKTTADVQLRNHSFVQASGSSSAYFDINGYRTFLDAFVFSVPDNVEGKPLVVFGKHWGKINNPIVD